MTGESDGPPRAVLIAAAALARRDRGNPGCRGEPPAAGATGCHSGRARSAGHRSRLQSTAGGAASTTRRVSARARRGADHCGCHGLANGAKQHTGDFALWTRPPGRVRGGFGHPSRRSGAVVSGGRAKPGRARPVHLVHRGPAGVCGADTPLGIGAHRDPGIVRRYRPHHPRGTHRPGAGSL
ncbi:LOW QUALITY PROTEIN: conserved secreted protein, partial [Mycobacterium tuberculosis T92]